MGSFWGDFTGYHVTFSWQELKVNFAFEPKEILLTVSSRGAYVFAMFNLKIALSCFELSAPISLFSLLIRRCSSLFLKHVHLSEV